MTSARPHADGHNRIPQTHARTSRGTHIEGPARNSGLAPGTPKLAPWNTSRNASRLTQGAPPSCMTKRYRKCGRISVVPDGASRRASRNCSLPPPWSGLPLWRCSGAEQDAHPVSVAIPPLRFDSPHLHFPPGILLESRGFPLPELGFRRARTRVGYRRLPHIV